jgi:pyridoxal phosphate enzyme (YggS family)
MNSATNSSLLPAPNRLILCAGGVIYQGRCDKQSAPMVDVAANYREIVDRITQAAVSTGRDPRDVKILGAAKAQDVKSIEAAIGAGVLLIGENYVQEASLKKKSLSDNVEWHMIGHLQRNKAKAAVELFDVIESLDNAELARELDKEGRKRNVRVRALIEINVGGEETKSGIAKAKVADLLRTIGQLDHLSIEGLMTVPPFREKSEETRPYFREMRQLRDELQSLQLPNVNLRELSMGMTHDYLIAVEEGATIVRVGTALFGPRRT